MSKTTRGAQPHPASPPAGERTVEVVEKDTDTAWALFEAVREQQQRGFERTAPAHLEAERQLQAQGAVSVDDVLVEARRNNRVCPLPAVWLKLYDFIPRKTTALAPVPATREEWTRMSALQKRTRLREHIEWAARQGVLKQVHQALKVLPEDRWHHMGD